jgi:hypothetical protein
VLRGNAKQERYAGVLRSARTVETCLLLEMKAFNRMSEKT